MASAEEAESIYAKAVKAEYNKELDNAFRLYVKAAETFLHLGRAIDNQRDKAKHKASAGKALERAERIKAFVEKSKSAAGPQTLTPVAVDHFSPRGFLCSTGFRAWADCPTEEQFYVLKKGSTVNGRVFPLWEDQNAVSDSTDNFQDPDGEVELSPEQRKRSPQWQRPSAALNTNGTVLASRLAPEDILQHIITDCSVCASISVCLEHSSRFGSQFGYVDLRIPDTSASIVLPISRVKSGRYDLRLLLNGAWRRVHRYAVSGQSTCKSHHRTVIDDTLPYEPSTGALVCMSSATGAIWPSLLEKGYMKLMGGYDFPGSNSSIDLHALIGWIPEHLEIKSPTFERERTWRRLFDAFTAGRCMFTLGTGIESGVSWRGVSLIPSHNYSVIDIKESEDGRILAVLDSWVPSPEESQRARIRHIPWSDAVQVFDSIYLSWDPRIWPRNLNFHGMWKQAPSPAGGDQRSTRNLRAQYQSADSSADDEIWVLLARHVTKTRQTTDFISLRAQLEDDLTGSELKDTQDTIAATGTYTNSSHVLVRLSLPPQTRGVLSIFASYDGPTPEVGFTLTVYAPESATIAWDKHVQAPPFSTKIEGSLVHKNAGGNSTHPTYMVNPQYHLRVHPPKTPNAPKKADVSLTMQMAREVPINVAVVWSQGQRVFELTQKDLVATSGAYTYGLARLSSALQGMYVGDYTVVLSAFEPTHLGTFSLEAQSSLPFDLKPIPQEGAGMYSKSIRGAWTAKNAMGSPSFKNYARNPIFEVDVQAPTEIKIRLQLVRPTPSSAINLTLFPAGSLVQHLTSSGGYDDSIAGVVTPQTKLAPGKYWMVPSTYSPGVHGPFEIVLYTTSGRVTVSAT
ncbi:Calpain catalytic domain-containing protein [Mycena chlorophos]|uniref:Calpain catalytic domain-containing protein n=1 Tax=Mycena chlorophos TaxID=658473 RepID=A0A8H6SFP3_MYCCL|nr:Calpain catalytic domain-containing protein [Mycena chlorophos]